MHWRYLKTLAWLSVLAVTSACQSNFPELLQDKESTTKSRWQEIAAQSDLPQTKLSWSQAVALLETSNLKLLKSSEAVSNGRDAIKRLPRGYLPELNLNVFASPSLDELKAGDLASTYFYLGGIFNVPTPWRYRASALQASLSYAISLSELEAQRRDLHVQLYRQFRKATKILQFEKELQAISQLEHIRPDFSIIRKKDSLIQQIEKGWLKVEEEMSELLGDYTHRWRPSPDHELPSFDYITHPPALDGSGDFAALQIMRTSLQLVALEAAKRGLQLSSLPQLSILISAPPIYQSRSGNSSFLSLDDLRVTPFVTYSTDFRGNRTTARKQQATRADSIRRELDITMQSTLLRLKDGVTLLARLDAKRTRLVEARQTLLAPSTATVASDIQSQIDELETQIEDLNLAFWVLDSSRWQTTSGTKATE